jgi:hypothetical protein
MGVGWSLRGGWDWIEICDLAGVWLGVDMGRWKRSLQRLKGHQIHNLVIVSIEQGARKYVTKRIVHSAREKGAR